jgi:4-hydroxy-3-polyprenylbenzoate decarboxylase
LSLKDRALSSTSEGITIGDLPEMSAHILPPVPSFYHQPKTIQDIIDQTIGKTFDYLGIEHQLFKRWGDGSHR